MLGGNELLHSANGNLICAASATGTGTAAGTGSATGSEAGSTGTGNSQA